MSIRNLDALFAPNSVAVFGASERPASVGGTGWHRGCYGFDNPRGPCRVSAAMTLYCRSFRRLA